MNMNSKTPPPLVGSLLTVIGAGHTGLGVVDWLTKDQPTELSFWFTGFGVVGMALGVAVMEVERARGYVPGPVLAAVAAMTACGLAFEPMSGFLTVLVPLGIGVAGWVKRRSVRTVHRG
ncbi:hypothetical protein IU418_06705 [Nocardia farcinica]|nr:hypothetical protein [Nocardia farcinica]